MCYLTVFPLWEYWLQRVANMARSRSLAVCFLITRMFIFLLICLYGTNAAMGYHLLLCPEFIIDFLI